MTEYRDFYKGKKVLITGHTGFKGTWMCLYLHQLGAKVCGVSLEPKLNDLFFKAEVSNLITDYRTDIRDKTEIGKIIDEYKPEIVFHLAAQPLVLDSYKNPSYTWDVNLMGTLNLLDTLKNSNSVRSVVIITTDKVYKNTESIRGYSEDNALGGYDPYSASKAAVEILVESYRSSYYLERKIGIATARSGNVIGGGDWGFHRLVPDFFRAYLSNSDFVLRNPTSIRPWQHVLDVIHGYLILGMKLENNFVKYSSSWNFGPDRDTIINTQELISRMNKNLGVVVKSDTNNSRFHETKFLSLDSSKSEKFLNWKNKLDINKSVELIKDIYLEYDNSGLRDRIIDQIRLYFSLDYL